MALPKKGPASQPTAPQVAVANPRTTKGSKPITCAPRDSRSCSERICTPIIVLAIEAIIDEARVYLRRDARSLKNEFQSSLGTSARDAFAAVELRRKAVLRKMGDRHIELV